MEKYFKVVVDTSIILESIKLKMNLVSELERLAGQKVLAVIPKPVMTELKEKKKGVGLKLLNALKYEVKNTVSKKADTALIEVAKQFKIPVATADQEVRKMARSMSIPVIYIRSMKKLDVDGFIGW